MTDADTTTTTLLDAGAELIALSTLTPWNSLNSRLHGPSDMQLTIFQELQAPESERLRPTSKPAMPRARNEGP